MSRHDGPFKQSCEQWLQDYLNKLDQWSPQYWYRKHIVTEVIKGLVEAPHPLKVKYVTQIDAHQFNESIVTYIEKMSKSMANYKVELDSPIMLLTITLTLQEISRLADSLQ